MNVTQKEIEAVIQLAPFDRYKYALKRIVDWEEMFSLEDEDGNGAFVQAEDWILYSIWPAKEYAELVVAKEWANYKVISISLDKFGNDVIPLIEDGNYLINVFAVNEQMGFPVSAEEFLRDIDEEELKYL